jgi:hypothetical protein
MKLYNREQREKMPNSNNEITRKLLEANILEEVDIDVEKMLLWKKIIKESKRRPFEDMRKIIFVSLSRKESSKKETIENMRSNY